jgi:ssDNA-binding Zn-finger/Zn-ribbon topoisomerase 1
MENKSLPCPVCGTGLIIRLVHGRKSGKPFVMLICPKDGRHIRTFINDKKFVGEALAKLENKESSNQ